MLARDCGGFNHKWVLYTFILLQALHSIFFVAISAADVFLNEYWQSSFERLLASLTALPILIATLWGMTHTRSWAWGLVLIVTVDLVCFAGWYWRYEDVLPKILLTAQLALTPLVFVVRLERGGRFVPPDVTWQSQQALSC